MAKQQPLTLAARAPASAFDVMLDDDKRGPIDFVKASMREECGWSVVGARRRLERA